MEANGLLELPLPLQDEIAEVRKELRHVQIRREVLNEEKTLLNKFTNHIATVHTVKVSGLGLLDKMKCWRHFDFG